MVVATTEASAQAGRSYVETPIALSCQNARPVVLLTCCVHVAGGGGLGDVLAEAGASSTHNAGAGSESAAGVMSR